MVCRGHEFANALYYWSGVNKLLILCVLRKIHLEPWNELYYCYPQGKLKGRINRTSAYAISPIYCAWRWSAFKGPGAELASVSGLMVMKIRLLNYEGLLC